MKYRLVKDYDEQGRALYSTEKKMFFFWSYVFGSASSDYDQALRIFNKIKQGHKFNKEVICN